MLLERGETAEALELLDRFRGDFEAEGLAARARLAAELGEDRGRRRRGALAELRRMGRGRLEGALEGLQEAIAEGDDPERRDLVRKVMVAIFTELGADHPLAREHRRRLAAALA